MNRGPRARVTVGRHAMVIGLAMSVVAGTAARAQTFYKWVDDKGTVHCADEPPANVQGVERRNLPPPPAEPAPEAAAPAGDDAKSADAAGHKAPAGEGPARIIVVSRQAMRSGPRALHIIGEV